MGGVGLATTESLLNAWMVGGWNLTAGFEIPAAWSRAWVPRMHFQSAGADNSGSIRWLRVALDSRAYGPGGAYGEAGLGMGLLSSPMTDYDDDGTARRQEVLFGTPFLQADADRQWMIDDGPSLVTEVMLVLGIGRETAAGFELVVGFSY